MRIYFEEHQYQATDEVLRDLRDICALQDVEKKISVGYVGYFFNKEVGDCIFILPKVLLKDLKNDPKWGNVPDTIADIPPKKDGSPVMPEDIISPEGQEENLSMEYRKFIYEFAVWIYRALTVYRKKFSDSQALYYRQLPLEGQGKRRRAESFLDVILSMISFNKENQNFFTFTIKNQHSGMNKINWTRTIARSSAIIQKDSVVYLNPINKKRQVNFDEELFIIFFSILNFVNEEYGFKAPINYGYELIRDAQFKAFAKRAPQKLRQIKYKYFSDKTLRMWDLCYAFFVRYHILAINTRQNEYLLAKSFNVVFEAMIDELIGEKDVPLGLKKQLDGKRVDHMFTHAGLTISDDQRDNDIYYIGDSKYYKVGHPLGSESVYKQYTYARNVIQWNIDLFMEGQRKGWSEEEEKERKEDFDNYGNIRLRNDKEDPRTEGYNIIPNFFLSAFVDKERKYVTPEDIKGHPEDPANPKKDEDGKIIPKTYISQQFPDRLFDRDTLILSHYDVNFLYVIYLYARDKRSEKDAWQKKVRNMFQKEIRRVLEREYSFYPMRSKGVFLDEYLSSHFRQLNGKVFTPFQDREVLTLALHTPKRDSDGKPVLTREQGELVSMLKQDFDIDEKYKLGKVPNLPPPTRLRFQEDDYVLVGFYKEQNYDWMIRKKLYNVRTGKDPGSLDLTQSVCAARFFLAYGKNGILKFGLEPNKLRIWSKADLEKSGYEKPSHDFYLMFFIKELTQDDDFAMFEIDEEQLKKLLNKYNKDKAGHDKGAVAVKMSELVNCIKDS